jgi:hypothetical protein
MSILTIAGFVIVSLILLVGFLVVLVLALGPFIRSAQISEHEREHGVTYNGVTYWPED